MMELLELGFESFQDSEKGIDAYVSVDDDPKTSEFFINDFAIKNSISLVFDKILIPATNWNQEWESSFEVIKVDNFCAIRAPFHAPVLDCLHEIVITPKMSFGTGHHPTTFNGKSDAGHRFYKFNSFGYGFWNWCFGDFGCKIRSFRNYGN